jgi:hypothetical protein
MSGSIPGNIVYLCYGRGPWIEELKYSVLSLTRLSTRDVRVLMVTDVPEMWDGWPVEVLPIEPTMMHSWSGPHDYAHRRKIEALRYAAVRHADAPTTLVDGDTYFTKPAAVLFDRIAEGRSVMHMWEGELGTVQGEMHRTLYEFLIKRSVFPLPSQRKIRIPARSAMWNAGVVGLSAADAALLPDVCVGCRTRHPHLRNVCILCPSCR